MAGRSGSQIIIDALVGAGTDIVFGYPGGAIMPLYDALLGCPLRHVLTRHEQAAIHAADGYARATGRLGVCLATSGPGATNLITGICTASMDSTPLICITGQVGTALIGTDAFQETDVPGVVAAITKHCYQVRSIEDLPFIMAEALFLAQSGRPGPVLVDVPKDVLVATTETTHPAVTSVPGYDPKPIFAQQDLSRAHHLLSESDHPVCIVGGGCKLSDATSVFRRWCALAQVPVITTLNGIGCVDPDYSGWLGMPGMHGHRRANQAITACDLILAMGIRFDDRVTGKLAEFAPHARIVHVDIDVAEINKLVTVDVALHGDLKEVLESWTALFETLPIKKSFDAWQRRAMSVGTGLSAPPPAQPHRVPPTALLNTLFETIGPDAIVVTDVGQHQMWAAQRVKCSHPRKWITSGGLGAMGFGLSAAMGAQLGCPDQRVVAVLGDGGFQMTLAELATIRRCRLPIKMLILDNQCLGMVRQWQELFFGGRYSGTDLSDNPDFAALARVYDINAFTLTEPDRLESTLNQWWSCDGPALLHAMCHTEDNVFPMVPANAGLADMVESA